MNAFGNDAPYFFDNRCVEEKIIDKLKGIILPFECLNKIAYVSTLEYRSSSTIVTLTIKEYSSEGLYDAVKSLGSGKVGFEFDGEKYSIESFEFSSGEYESCYIYSNKYYVNNFRNNS